MTAMSFYDIEIRDSQVVEIMLGLVDRNGKAIHNPKDKVLKVAKMLSPDAHWFYTETATEPSVKIVYDFEGPIDFPLVFYTANFGGHLLNQKWVKINWPGETGKMTI